MDKAQPHFSGLGAMEARLDAFMAQYGPQYPPGSPERRALEQLKATLKKQREIYTKMATLSVGDAVVYLPRLKETHTELTNVFEEYGGMLRKIGVDLDT